MSPDVEGRRIILVADDNPPNLELTREILSRRGFEVVTAVDGREVLDKIELVCPDLLLLDIQMPNLDGYGVVESVRKKERFARLPIVAASASAMDSDRRKAIANGFDAYLEKPYDFDDLIAIVMRIIGLPPYSANK